MRRLSHRRIRCRFEHTRTTELAEWHVFVWTVFAASTAHVRTLEHSALGTGSTKVQKQCVIWRNASFTRCVCSIRRSYAEESSGRSETTVKRLERYTSATRPHCFRSETLRRGILCANNEAPLFFWLRNWRPIMRTWMTGRQQNA